MRNDRYDQTIRVFTVFFSALMGFGLKHLLDDLNFDQDHGGINRWPCFILGILLFLRFLLGSANHPWLQYSSNAPNTEARWSLLRDFCWLTILGILALVACYSETVSNFLFWEGCLVGTAAVDVSLELTIFRSAAAGTWMKGWLWINLIQLGFIFGAHRLDAILRTVPYFGYSWSLIILIALFAFILLWDFSHQLSILETPHQPDALRDQYLQRQGESIQRIEGLMERIAVAVEGIQSK
jgi:hypothetical protein